MTFHTNSCVVIVTKYFFIISKQQLSVVLYLPTLHRAPLFLALVDQLRPPSSTLD